MPLVVGAAGDLRAQGLGESLAPPGGHRTGLTLVGPAREGKRLERLQAAALQLIRVAVLGNPAHPASARHLAALAAAAQLLGVQLHRVDARDPRACAGVVAAIPARRAEALLVANDAVCQAHRHRLVALVATHRLPAVSGIPGFAAAGGLLPEGNNPLERVRRAATHVVKLLQGAKPSALPVERPLQCELVMNLKTAKALGLTVPPTVLCPADEVMQ